LEDGFSPWGRTTLYRQKRPHPLIFLPVVSSFLFLSFIFTFFSYSSLTSQYFLTSSYFFLNSFLVLLFLPPHSIGENLIHPDHSIGEAWCSPLATRPTDRVNLVSPLSAPTIHSLFGQLKPFVLLYGEGLRTQTPQQEKPGTHIQLSDLSVGEIWFLPPSAPQFALFSQLLPCTTLWRGPPRPGLSKGEAWHPYPATRPPDRGNLASHTIRRGPFAQRTEARSHLSGVRQFHSLHNSLSSANYSPTSLTVIPTIRSLIRPTAALSFFPYRSLSISSLGLPPSFFRRPPPCTEF
jgi:hypothetical protein